MVRPGYRQRLGVVVATRTLVDLGIEDPGVAGPSVKQAPYLLRRRAHIDVSHISSIMIIIHHQTVGVVVLLAARVPLLCCQVRVICRLLLAVLDLLDLQEGAIPSIWYRTTSSLASARQNESGVAVILG